MDWFRKRGYLDKLQIPERKGERDFPREREEEGWEHGD